MKCIMIYTKDDPESLVDLTFLNEDNLTCSINEWVSHWPNSIFFEVEIVPT